MPNLQQAAGHKPKEISSKVRFLSSNIASVISVTACFPLEVLKTRMQIQVIIEKFSRLNHDFLGLIIAIELQFEKSIESFPRRRHPGSLQR